VRSNRADDGCVLDCSVALALVLIEPWSGRAEHLMASLAASSARIATPWLFDLECASGLIRAVRRRRLDPARALDDLLDLLDLPIERLEASGAEVEALLLALEYGISAYDAVYVALAAEEGLPLVTADARLVRALEGSPHTVLHLDDVDYAPLEGRLPAH
jgi:predicted nucleic acid-binding protein